MEITYSLSQSVLSRTQTTTLDLLLTFQAETPTKTTAGGRRPLNLCLVIDKSGSMHGKPLDNATRAAELLVKQLGPDDVLSVVAYDNMIETVVPPGPVTDPAAIGKLIRKIRSGGATNLHGGWNEGCKLVAEATGRPFLRRVLLLTDGQANIGITHPAQLISLAKEQAQAGIITTTLGFGQDFNEDLLIGMAEAAGGNFYYIETPEDATQVFLIEGESLTSIAAQHVTLTLRPNQECQVSIQEVLNRFPAQTNPDGSIILYLGDLFGGEDKLLALTLAVPPQNRKPSAFAQLWKKLGLATGEKQALPENAFPLVEARFSFHPATAGGDEVKHEDRLLVVASLGSDADVAAAPVDMDALRAISRIRVARAKELAVEKGDTKDFSGAATWLRQEIAILRARGMEQEFEIAEEIAQLEYFAEQFEQGRFPVAVRKMMRDQAYQGRNRNRSDLNARGSGGGSAKGLETTEDAGNGVVVVCVREGGKLRLKAVSEGFDQGLNVLFPRSIREEGAQYVVEGLTESETGTFYLPVGTIRRFAGTVAGTIAGGGSLGDPLGLTELFQGGGEPWLPLLKPAIEALPEAASFIGTNRDQNIVPVRELTFQALKPNPPEKWKVVVFGQNPYPRVESATGIAMFDNTFGDWKDSQFGKVTSIRCIIKAAAMWKHGIPKATPIADIRALLARHSTVQPPEWFQAILTQGVLLLNASLTASSDATRNNAGEIARHTDFWKPVVEKIVEEILRSKQAADDHHKGVVFVWWGSHAKALRRTVERLQKKYPAVPVKHIDHPNPAAQGDIFCDGNHFGTVNEALRSLQMDEVDWLPSSGWNKAATSGKTVATSREEEADRMGDFISKTMELHKFYLERLQEVKEEAQVDLPGILGILNLPPVPFDVAMNPITGLVKGIEHFAKRSVEFAQRKVGKAQGKTENLTEHEIAALYLYTCESLFYRHMNAALRNPNREAVQPYHNYLHLLLSALAKLKHYSGSLWRGVALDMRGQYPKDRLVTWWGVSSCTSKLSVAHAFLGSKGKRTLFEVIPTSAVSIKLFSAFTGEEEYLLAPGTRLKVVEVLHEKTGLSTIRLEEQAGDRGVS